MEKVVIGVTVLLLLFFTQVTPERIEQEIEKAMKQSLNAKSVDVELEGSPGFPTLKGKFKKLTVSIEGLNFAGGQLLDILPIGFTDKPQKEGKVNEVSMNLYKSNYEGLEISEIQAHAQKVRFDLKGSLKEKRLVLVSAASGILSGFIAANSIQKYLADHASKHGFESFQTHLRHESVEIEGLWKVKLAGVNIVQIPFNAVAELFPIGNEVHWKLREARIADLVPLPVGWLQEQFQNLNPLIRFDFSPLQVQLKTLKISSKGVYIFANFSLSP